ncbi:MAG: PAS domain S-box protein [Desulfomicrobium sp.]
MDELVQLLEEKESWIVDRILGYASEYGYTKYSSTLPEAWRMSVNGLIHGVSEGLRDGADSNLELLADTDWTCDNLSRFAVLEARRHRQRGITLGMFLGLFTYYRQSFQDAVNAFMPSGEIRVIREKQIVRVFDRMCAAFCSEWASLDGQEVFADIALAMREMTNEKNRYLTFFESLSSPAICFGSDGIIISLNCAAVQILLSSCRQDRCHGGATYCDDAISVCGRPVKEVFPWLEELVVAAQAGDSQTIEVSILQAGELQARYFRAVVNRQPDVSGKYIGFSLILHDQTEIRRRQEQLRVAKEEVDRTFDAISDLIFLVDERNNVLRGNKALMERLGVSQNNLVGKSCMDLLGINSCDFIATDTTRRSFPMSFGAIPGKYLVNSDVLRDQEGRPCGRIVVARDVTTLENIRETLLTIENKYKNIFDNAPYGIFQVCSRGFMSINPALARTLGFDNPDEMRAYFTDVPLQLYASLDERAVILKEALSHGSIRDRDLRLKRKDGSIFWARINGRIIFDDKGELEYFEGFMHDVTELRTFMDRLSKSEKLFRSLAETMHQGLVQIDVTGRATYCNDHFCDLVRHSREEILGEDLVRFVHPDDRSEYQRFIGYAERKASPDLADIRWLTSDAHVFSIVTPVSLEEDDASPGGFWLLVMDVTGRKLIESQMLHNQKLEAIGLLAAGIAHEINTPAQYMLNYTSFIKEAVENLAVAFAGHGEFFERWASLEEVSADVAKVFALDSELQVRFYFDELPAAISETVEGLDKISAIVSSVKQFVHPGHVHQMNVDLNRLVADTVNLCRNEWKYVSELVTDLDPGLPPVPCLSQEIGQVLLNLVVNAAHAISEARERDERRDGRILIRTRKRGDWAEIRVVDNGCGIPPYIQNHIFEPFFTTKPIGTGTGQGLFIVYTIVVKNHGGSVSFETKAGQGTSFIFSLPLVGKGGQAVPGLSDVIESRTDSII